MKKSRTCLTCPNSTRLRALSVKTTLRAIRMISKSQHEHRMFHRRPSSRWMQKRYSMKRTVNSPQDNPALWTKTSTRIPTTRQMLRERYSGPKHPRKTSQQSPSSHTGRISRWSTPMESRCKRREWDPRITTNKNLSPFRPHTESNKHQMAKSPYKTTKTQD